MEKEYENGQMAENMKENMFTTNNKVKVFSSGPTVDLMKAAGEMENSTDLVNTRLLKDIPDLGNGLMAGKYAG